MRRGPSSAAPMRDPARESSRAGAAAPAGSDGPGIMLVAGEASGDLHGATLCGALAELAPGWRLFGMGGARMAAAGMDVLVDVTAHAVVGGSGAVGRLPMLYGAYRRLVRRLETDAVVLGLLPGSRAKEVERLLPALRDAALELTRARPGVRCLVGLAPTVDRARVAGLLRGAPGIEIVEHDARAVMAAADLL